MAEPAAAIARQRDYYARTAAHYDAMHVRADDEHGLALAAFAGIARLFAASSVLDVGAGTGRALARLSAELPNCHVLGIEPVAELRAVGHAQGIAEDRLIEGDACALPFANDSFDFVIETGMLHHLPDPASAVREMVRVARLGVMLSDANKFGQGSAPVRFVKSVVGRLGLWNAAIWLTTGGKMAKWSEGDGQFWSYSVFDTVGELTAKFPRQHWLNTVAMSGSDLKRGAASVAVVALKG